MHLCDGQESADLNSDPALPPGATLSRFLTSLRLVSMVLGSHRAVGFNNCCCYFYKNTCAVH